MTFKYYHANQDSAPQISTNTTDAAVTYNAMVEVFRAVLVTGYGLTAGAGWTEPYAAGPDGEVFFKSPSTDVDWGIRFDGVAGTAANSGQIKVTLLKGATSLTTFEYSQQFALTTNWAGQPRQQKWKMYVNANRILFYPYSTDADPNMVCPCLFGYNDLFQMVIEAPHISPFNNTSGQYPIPFAPVQLGSSAQDPYRAGYIKIADTTYQTKPIGGPMTTFHAASALSYIGPTSVDNLLLYPPQLVDKFNRAYLGDFGEGIYYMEISYDAFPGFHKFEDQTGNQYHVLMYASWANISDPYAPTYYRLMAVKVST